MASRSTILVIAERSGDPQSALQKASILARHLGTGIELFSCDEDHAWAVAQRHSSADARLVLDACLADSLRYLGSLRGSVAANDLEIHASVACARSLHEGLLARVDELRPRLLVKDCTEALVRGPGVILRSDERQLIRNPPAPLLLSRGRPWAPVPQITAFCAAGGSVDRDTSRERQLGEELAASCHGHFSCFEYTAETDLEALIAQQRVDVLIVAAEGGEGEASQPRVESLIGNVHCDVLVVPRASSVGGLRVGGARTVEAAILADTAHR